MFGLRGIEFFYFSNKYIASWVALFFILSPSVICFFHEKCCVIVMTKKFV